MTRALALALALALVAAAALAFALQEARADLKAAQARVVAFEKAAQIHAGHVARLQAAADDAAALDRELAEGEGADAPLSDYLRRGAGRLWP